MSGRYSRLRECLDQILVHGPGYGFHSQSMNALKLTEYDDVDYDMPDTHPEDEELTHPTWADDKYYRRMRQLFAAVRFQKHPNCIKPQSKSKSKRALYFAQKRHQSIAKKAKRSTDNHPGLPSTTVDDDDDDYDDNRGGCEPTTPLDAPQTTVYVCTTDTVFPAMSRK